jgi:hypothetical protein
MDANRHRIGPWHAGLSRDDVPGMLAGNPRRLTHSTSKAEIERTDTWTVMSGESFLAALQRLVAQRESFLTRPGTRHVCRTRLNDQGARALKMGGSNAGDSIETAFIADIPASCTPPMCSTVSHAAPNAAEIATAPPA